jgi:hypothetical protein
MPKMGQELRLSRPSTFFLTWLNSTSGSITVAARSDPLQGRPLKKGLMSPRTLFLAVVPNFLRGVGSSIDLGGVLEDEAYNISTTPAEADAKAALSDWSVVGVDLNRAATAVMAEKPK